ncbi:MAG: hypothetical protein V4622_02725 [Bacteroidota bacterium]
MNKILFVLFTLLNTVLFSQLETLDLKNVIVVSQLDKAEDRFTLEINLAEILANHEIKTMASLNAQKQGANILSLGMDSIQLNIKNKGFDTYMLVCVRGYDSKFKAATIHNDMRTELGIGHLFPLYRDEITSITLEFSFYRNGQFVAYDILKLGGISSREDVIKKLRKKLPKRIEKYWK